MFLMAFRIFPVGDVHRLKDSVAQCHNSHGRLGSRSVRGRVVLITESSGCFWPEDVHSSRCRIVSLAVEVTLADATER